MVDVLKCDRIRKAFVHYKHLKACIQSTLGLLLSSSGVRMGKLCELFQCLLAINELHMMVTNLFFTRVSEVVNIPEMSTQKGIASLRNDRISLVITILLILLDREAQLSPQNGNVSVKMLQLVRDLFEVRLYVHIYLHMYTCVYVYVLIVVCTYIHMYSET